MGITIIALKDNPALYESTRIACYMWQEISPDLHISTCSHEREGIGGEIAEGLIGAANSPRKVVVQIHQEAFDNFKEVVNQVTQYMQSLEGWKITILDQQNE